MSASASTRASCVPAFTYTSVAPSIASWLTQ